MEESKIKVYVKVDKNNCIVQIESYISSQYIDFSKDWILIDEGFGDKYALAQGNYFTIDGKKTLRDFSGKCNYKLVDNKPVELTEQEKEVLFPPMPPVPTKEEQLQRQLLETQNMLLELQEQILLNKQIK